ncbi:MAG: TonB-dependent receptor [Tannerellaceae bacterium]|jgi:TonB-linked SusC/RagA family outer membrane protein|nr:TonB-dependent receptor [Tannerellaceae bacterium]
MRCIFLFIILGTLQSLATVSYSQSALLTLEKENTTIQEILSTIENESEFYFTYNLNQINVNKKTSVRVANKDITEILNILFPEGDVKYIIHDRHVVLYKEVAARSGSAKDSDTPGVLGADQQARIISGTVTDEFGEPLIGVNVAVKGTTNGSVTDVNGNFTLQQVSEGSTLMISYVGHITQEILVGSQSFYLIVLREDTQSLDEVVVVGYGVQKKQTLSGSVTSIGAEDISSTKTENVISNIQGKMPGLLIRQRTGEPGVFDNLISIRGYGNPLVVIDGVTRPMEDGASELAQLNTDDIENISILKDASAAIYGMNAANGVIIVTTKKGQDGKARVSYSNLFGMKGATGMEMTVDAYTYRLMANEMQRNIGATPTYSDEILEKYRNNEPGYNDHNWLKMFLNDWAFQQQHNISVRGGTDKVKYFNSFAYAEDNGLLKGGNQKYNRFNFRSNTTAEIAKGLQLNVNVSGRLDNSEAPRDEFQWLYKILMINDRGKNWHTIDNENHLTSIEPERKNAYALADPDIDGYRRYKNFNYSANLEMTYKVPFVDGLTLGVLGAYDGYERNESKLHKMYDLYDYYTDEYVVTNGAGTYSNTIRLFQKVHARGQVNYTRSLGNHNFNVMGVAELTATRMDELQGMRRYAEFYTHDIINQGTATTASNSGFRRYGRLAAYLGRINYDYAGKYLLEGVVRYDGSYRYAPSKRWAFFPSVSAGWRLSEESFIKDNLAFISNLKLRVSYGKSGYDAGNEFEYVAGYTAQSNSNSNYMTDRSYVFEDGQATTGMVPPGVVNDNLSWVTSATSNIGVDLDLWHGKLGFVLDLFQRENTGLLASRIQSVPNTFGSTFPQENINSTVNRGFEISVTHRGQVGKDFNYSVSANFTYARTKELHYERAPHTSSWDRWVNGREDRYTGRMWLYEYEGQYTSLEEYETAPLLGGTQGNSKMLPGSYKITDLNGDGVIDGNDRQLDNWAQGNLNPPMQFGFNLSASYRSFDLNALFQGAAGYSINYSNGDIWGYGRYPTLHEKFMDRWHTTGTTDDPYNPATSWIPGFYPALRSNFSNTTDQHSIDIWIPNAAYLRLKSLEIGYTIPRAVLRKTGIAGLRVFLNGFNLLTFCRKELRQADPEREERDWNANAAYPLMKTFNVGFNINF